MSDLEFHFDIASANCLPAERVMVEIEKRRGVAFERVPVLLGGIFKATGNQAPFASFGHVKSKMAYQRIEFARFLKRHGITDFRMNPHFPVGTITVQRALTAAKRRGQLMPAMNAAYRGMWTDGLAMGEPDVVRSVFDAAGLDGKALVEAARDPEIKAELIAQTERSVAMGTFGAPTFYVRGEIFFGKDSLSDLEDAL